MILREVAFYGALRVPRYEERQQYISPVEQFEIVIILKGKIASRVAQ